MTFKELQDAVLNDRFRETQRSDVKNWINSRYGRLWSSEPWSFKNVTENVTINSGLNTGTTTLQRVNRLYDTSRGAYYIPLPADRVEDFYDNYYSAGGQSGSFSFINGSIVLDRPTSGNTVFKAVGEKAFAKLVNDNDVPLIPEEFHMALVSGASAVGLKLQNDPSWAGLEDDFQRAIGELKAAYLTSVRTYNDAYPSWPWIS